MRPRIRPRILGLTWVACLLLILPAGFHAPLARADETVAREKWADPGLKVTDGLELWLDAGRQGAAREALGKPELHDGDKVETWYDASGRRRDVGQKVEIARPTFRDAGPLTAVRFDGIDAWLGLDGLNRGYKDLTVIVVAAPFANSGDFRAFLAMNQSGKNDYSSGLTLDQSFAATDRFDALNVEGVGFQGVANLLTEASTFGTVRTLTVTSTPGSGGTWLYADGKPQGRRDRADTLIRLDQLTVGARRYDNSGAPPRVQGFLAGDLLEILVYDRLLAEAERKEVERYLMIRHGERKQVAVPQGPAGSKPLVRVPDLPPVQVLVPGFTVKQLPVDLPNINNVRYRPDGKLVALGYNGNIYLLSESSGHGVEDRVELFWDNKGGELRAPIGMALTPPGYPRGDGVFVACKGKVSLIVDTDGDGKADKEIVVASGWQELPHGVDVLGVALDKDGNVFFGLGAADFTNAYQVDASGQGRYDLKSERGTVLKVSADFKRREVVATGVRFTVGLAFNRHGDLFATDQEGATWLPNGNPLDELLHIEKGRHYGFPPRHPRHLPGVIDEPSVYDYGPQHQSTCGLNFNEPVSGGPVFGPAWWAGDALISGYSRGKLYRTKLVKTPAGYVAQNNLFACLNMLAVDACVSPRGELVVSTHSGPPDWGTGPTGKGKLFKIVPTAKAPPRPVLAWAAGPREVRIAFDAPLDPSRLQDLIKQVSIEHGRYVRPGDRFESLRPGYDVVRRQLAAPRYELPVLSAQLTGDWQTLLLTTAPHSEASSYAVTLPGLGRPARPDAGELPQTAAIDLGYDLCGVAATWQAAEGEAAWSGWLPHPDLAVSHSLTAASADHKRFRQMIRKPGRLTLHTKLDLWQMLRPAVQPGSTLDYTLPAEQVKVTFTGSETLALSAPGGKMEAKTGKGRRQITVTVSPREGEPLPLEILVDTGDETALEVSYATAEDPRPRALPLQRLLLPWAATARQAEVLVRAPVPELQGGNWARGRQIFQSEQALCAKCHQVRGEGGKIGPDLSNLVHRDYESVLRDVRDPSAAINPDYLTYIIELKTGRSLTGTVRTEGDTLVIGDAAGKLTTLARAEVEAMQPSAVSTMPQGLDKAIGPTGMRDLLTFLLVEPLQPAPLEAQGAPPSRPRAELDAVLKDSMPPAKDPRKLHVVLAAGPKDHGPGEHDYPLWQRRWANLLLTADGVTVSEVTGFPSTGHLEKADVVVFYSNNPGWTAEKGKDLDAFLARGGGLVYLHYAVEGHKDVDALKERIGLAWQGGKSKYRHGPIELDFTASRHPISRGFRTVKFVDESYWDLAGDAKSVDILATGVEDKEARPLLWTREVGKGCVFVSIPGHYTWTFDDPLFRVLLLRGILWTAHEPVDRFNELATVGARIKE